MPLQWCKPFFEACLPSLPKLQHHPPSWRNPVAPPTNAIPLCLSAAIPLILSQPFSHMVTTTPTKKPNCPLTQVLPSPCFVVVTLPPHMVAHVPPTLQPLNNWIFFWKQLASLFGLFFDNFLVGFIALTNIFRTNQTT